MIASAIGRRFLNAYNRANGSTYTAKEFFVQTFFPLFYDCEKYMQWVPNSPFVQGLKKGVPPSSRDRAEKLKVFTEKVSQNNADASVAIGFPSMDVTATTSGQITNLQLPLNQEDIFCSWIGSGLGIGVQGGLSILIDNEQVLLDVFNGWSLYRDFLNKTPNLRGNQINTWNGQWISHRYDPRKYNQTDRTAGFTPFSSIRDGGIEVTTQSWVQVMLGLARNFSGQVVGYVYNLGQTNTTIGFIPFNLPEIKRPLDLYEKYFGTSHKAQVENLFGTAFGFTKACMSGSVGINAMEPKGLRVYITSDKMPVLRDDDEERKISFNTYQIWLLAMLNNEQLWDSAHQIAVSLSRYAASSEKGKTDKTNKVKSVLTAVSKKQYIENMTPIIEDAPDKDLHMEMAKLVNAMPADNVPYFLTLVRFQYAATNNKTK